MNVVVSAIVDPWVTTLSFVVALAMRIQGANIRCVHILLVIFVILHRKNERLFGRVQFG